MRREVAIPILILAAIVIASWILVGCAPYYHAHAEVPYDYGYFPYGPVEVIPTPSASGGGPTVPGKYYREYSEQQFYPYMPYYPYPHMPYYQWGSGRW